jgi:AraC-like DNA-binding protein
VARIAPTGSVVIVRALANAIRQSGLDVRDYLAALGLAPSALDDVEARFSADLVTRAWDLAAEHVSDPCFGLRLVESADRGTFDLVEYVTRSCATFGDALANLARYYRLLEDIAEIAIEVQGDTAQVVYRAVDPAWDPRLRHCAEATMAAWMKSGRRAAGASFSAFEITFRHSAPGSLEVHRRVFGPHLRFEAPRNAIRFDRRFLNARVPTADEGLRRVLHRQADAVLAGLPAPQDFAARIRHELVRSLPRGGPTVAEVARSLGVSQRTLQRELAQEGTTFQTLVADVRHHLARQYLGSGQISIAEISFLLGFSEPAAFQRAFRRWSGVTPVAFRNRMSRKPSELTAQEAEASHARQDPRGHSQRDRE